jgi:DNA-binding MarR family transcriptional regulator
MPAKTVDAAATVETEASPVDALQQIREARRLIAELTPRARAAGLSLEGYLALTALSGAPDGLSMSELAHATGATPPTLTRHIDTLATNSLVFREIDPEDRRSTLIHISRLGQSRLRAVETT